MEDEYRELQPINQLCFPLYAVSKEIIRKYTPYLEKLDLTYTQYLTLLVLQKKSKITVKELGKTLYLDSGTLSPLLKKMESKGLVTRTKSIDDERIILVGLTEKGIDLKEKADCIPKILSEKMPLNPFETVRLQELLYKLLNIF